MVRRLAVFAFFGALFLLASSVTMSAVGREGAADAQHAAAARGLASGPLRTGVVDVQPFLAPDAATYFRRVRASGATVVRLILFWKYTGLTAPERPPNFDASNPADPNYQWDQFDRQVRLAVANGLQPIVGIQLAPSWAERGAASGNAGTRRPSPAEFAAFAKAASRRYGGNFLGLPRVHYWQAWNEPNFTDFLNPQSPDLYRELVNAFADAVHSVHRDNLVIAGGTSPFGFPGVAVPPQRFMRELLCVSAAATPKPTCNQKIRFDVWTHHPYTTGGPTHRAQAKDDVSLGDLPEMRRTLVAALEAGHVVSRGNVQFWVTEFSWDSNPPDPVGVPTQLHARWVSEALYRMWQSGVSLVTWYQIRDDPIRESQFQSGLYLRGANGPAGDRPKLALRAFRFPFVAFSSANGLLVWGRTPTSKPAKVVVEALHGKRWATLRVLSANRYGIFTSRLLRTNSNTLRARLVARKPELSVPFSLTRPKDRYYWPFGCGGILPCP